MNKLKNIRTLALIVWVVAIVVSALTMPNLTRLGQEKGQIELPAHFESQKATKILNDMKYDGKASYQFAIVFYDKDGLKPEEKKEMNKALKYFSDHRKEYNITDTFFYNDSAQAKKQLVSKDGTTIINQITIEKGSDSATEVANKLYKKLDNLPMKTYITGSDLVMDDFSQKSQEGVQKTEIVAIIFIIVILILVFRSPIVPFVSLISVGVAYIVSLNIITQLVEHFNFPFSNFTQVFLVVILFGIGTDYNILLLTRFREELVKQGDALKAVSTTYKTAGKTVLCSGISVLFGLCALFFAEFNFYRATGGVAIGVLVLLIVLFTLNPFFMGLLGMKLFWPMKKAKSHADNKLWSFLSKHAFAHPIIAILLVAILAVPSIMMYTGNLNFNDLDEIDNKYASKQAINIIGDHFPAGMSSPTTLIIKNDDDDKLTKSASLQEIDRLTARLTEIDGIDKVYSVTRPEGKEIKALYLGDQLNTVTNSLNQMKQGTQEVLTGLSGAGEQSAEATQAAAAQLPAAVATQMETQEEAQGKGLQQATAGLQKIEAGLGETEAYTKETGKANQNVLNIPNDVLTGKAFKQSLNTYMNHDRTMTTMTIILKENPYNAEAMKVMEETQNVAHSFIESSSLHDAKVYLGGETMSNVNLQEMSKSDFKRSIIIILIGISVMLLFITRSLAHTLVILISLVVASFASLGITEWIATTFLNVDALSWNVPFFTYIMLITLGVDYSIFLMMRYKENSGNRLDLIVDACKKMGGVILSAAIILAGTFAALMPSDIDTLIQVAIAVMIGIAWLALLLIPVFVPATFGLGNKMNAPKKDEK